MAFIGLAAAVAALTIVFRPWSGQSGSRDNGFFGYSRAARATLPNFRKLHDGETKQDVRRLLGQPDTFLISGSSECWTYPAVVQAPITGATVCFRRGLIDTSRSSFGASQGAIP